MIIINEKRHAENILNGIYDNLEYQDMAVVVKYLKSQDKKKKEILKTIFEIYKKKNIVINEYKVESYIEKCINRNYKMDLRTNNDIAITKQEIDSVLKIKEEKNDAISRVYFIMICLAKYDKKNPYRKRELIEDDDYKNDLWLSSNYSLKDIFKLAHATYSKSIRDDMLYFLNSNGYVTYFFSGSMKMKTYEDCDDSLTFQSNDSLTFQADYDMILQWEKLFGNKKIACCDSCGKLILKKSNRMKYCKKCSVEIKKEKDRLKQEQKRNNRI